MVNRCDLGFRVQLRGVVLVVQGPSVGLASRTQGLPKIRGPSLRHK